MYDRSSYFSKLILLLLLCLNWTSYFGKAEERMLDILKPLKKYGAETKRVVQVQWQKYQEFQQGIQKFLLDSQDDPQGALEELRFNGTIKGMCYVPQICGNQNYPIPTKRNNGTIAHRQGLSRNDERESDESNEDVFQEREPRQDITPANIFPFIGLLGFLSIAPFLVANLAMTFVVFGLSVSSLSDGTRVTELHQAQLNALAGYGGVPAAVVDPTADGAAATRSDDNSLEELNHSQEKPMRIGRPYPNQNGVIEKTRQDLDKFLRQYDSMSLISKAIAILVIGGTLIAISLGLSLFGPVTFLLSFVFLGIPLLTSTGTILGFLNPYPMKLRKRRASTKRSRRDDLYNRILLSSVQLYKAKL